MIRLWIKGDEVAAKQAAEERDLPIRIEQSRLGTTIAQTEENNRAKVVSWFIEPVEASANKGGFPPGTLMLHN